MALKELLTGLREKAESQPGPLRNRLDSEGIAPGLDIRKLGLQHHRSSLYFLNQFRNLPWTPFNLSLPRRQPP